MRKMSRVAVLGLAATAASAVPAQAGVTAPSGGRAYERVTAQGTSAPPTGAVLSDDATRAWFRWGATLPQATNGFVSQNGYVAQRSASGWTMAEAVPGPGGVRRPEFFTFDASGSRSIVASEGVQLGVDAGVWRLDADGSLTELLRIPAPSATTAAPYFRAADASDDLSRVFVIARVKLVPEALDPPGYNIYEVTSEGVRLASVAPNGTAVNATPGNMGSHDPIQSDAISRDGRIVIFQDSGGIEQSIYARIDGTHTVDVSASQRSTPDPAGVQNRSFEGASDDGKHIYFQSAEALTDDAQTDSGTRRELYEYDVESGQLRTITPGFGSGVAPDVYGLTAVAPDASRVYFVASAVLPGSDAVDGGLNLYRYSSATNSVRYIATLEAPFDDGQGGTVRRDSPLAEWTAHWGLAKPTPDGRKLVFLAYGALTGPESTDANGANRFNVYLYDDTSHDLTCISCGAPGTRAADDSAFTINLGSANQIMDRGPSAGSSPFFSASRVMSTDSRRIFFTTRNALVPEDVNGRYDVYEWSDGAAHLISPGRGPHDAAFEGSTPSGDDVVFATNEQLVGSDTDVLSDFYDARVGGGFPAPAAPAAPCAGDACKAPPTRLPAPPVAASITFNGPATSDVPRLTPPAAVAKLTVTGRSIRGAAVTVKVKVNAAGRLSISGSRVVAVHKTVSRAGTYSLRVRLSSAARRSLKRHGRLKVGLRVGYVPKQGRASSKIFSVSLKG